MSSDVPLRTFSPLMANTLLSALGVSDEEEEIHGLRLPDGGMMNSQWLPLWRQGLFGIGACRASSLTAPQ